MWLVVIIQLVGTEPKVETIRVDTYKDCTQEMNWVRAYAVKTRTAVNVGCLEIPSEQFSERDW